ncbi:unnamed protein product [Meloidogyne enterolobii]|uniref:Uncharacterized protein n=1 Tax=Meloidogyne enterolobii TaxID=390850 RepID=A0ACB1AS81_MELEN
MIFEFRLSSHFRFPTVFIFDTFEISDRPLPRSYFILFYTLLPLIFCLFVVLIVPIFAIII